MNIQFDDEQMMMCQEAWNELDPEERIQMSHYDLAKNTYIDSTEIWMEFMSEPAVQEQLSRELLLYKEAQQRKLIAKANVNDKSMGTAQLINALDKTMTGESKKVGDIIIYSYVPMNMREAEAPNVTAEVTGVFSRGNEDDGT